MASLESGRNLEKRKRHFRISSYPFLINLFPPVIFAANGSNLNAPFQLTLAANASARVPLRLPRDAVFQDLWLRFDVTDGNYSCLLTDIKMSLELDSGGGRISFLPLPLGLMEGTNSGTAQVVVPYIHPKEGSVTLVFENLYPGSRAISGYLYGKKVQS